MIAEAIKRDIGLELILCRSPRDVKRIFTSAETDFRTRNVPSHRRQQVLREIRRDLRTLIDRADDPKSQKLISEAESMIDHLLVQG